MSVFSLMTLAALVVVGDMVVRLNRTGTEAAAPAALSVRASDLHRDPALNDPATGLSYKLLGAPWRSGCPRGLSTSEFSWTGGEAAVAGAIDKDGARGGTDWYANACSGPLPQQFRGYSAGQAAWAMADAVESEYYSELKHSVSVVRSAAVRVGGQPGWLAEFQVHYDRGQHLAWSSELAGVVVTGNAVFYVSVPDNLGTRTVATLLSSLR
jgi:hypothetical protein